MFFSVFQLLVLSQIFQFFNQIFQSIYNGTFNIRMNKFDHVFYCLILLSTDVFLDLRELSNC